MRVILDENEKKMLQATADSIEVEPEKLLECFEEVMTGDFDQNLWDVATENLELLGGRDYEKEAYEQDRAFDELRHGR